MLVYFELDHYEQTTEKFGRAHLKMSVKWQQFCLGLMMLKLPDLHHVHQISVWIGVHLFMGMKVHGEDNDSKCILI